MLTDYMSYTLDSTTYQMMLVSRFQMLSWSIYDGTVDRVALFAPLHSRPPWTAEPRGTIAGGASTVVARRSM